MKKIGIFLLCILFLVSCQLNDSKKTEECKVEKQNFKGFCDLMIGSDFKSIPSYNKFKKTNEDLYYADTYELSKDIGCVSFVRVMLKNGRIKDVGFTSSSISNKNKLDSCFKSYNSIYLNLSPSNKNRKDYKSNDDVIITTLILNSEYLYHMYGHNPINYFYFDSTGLGI